MTDPSAPLGRRAVVGGLILLVLGILLGWIGVAGVAAPGVEGIDLGQALAPIFLVLAAPPLVAAAGIFRRQRWAYILGIVVGVMHGATFLLISGGQSVPALVGLLFLGAAIVLLDALRSRPAR